MSAADGTTTSALLKSFAEGLADNAGGQIGALIFGSIFPGGNPPIDIGDLCQKISDIVFNENLEFKLDDLEGMIEGVIQKVAVDYNDKKNAGFTHISPAIKESDFKATLLTDVRGYVSTTEDVESQLSTRDEFMRAAFPLYLLVVNLLLSLLQEEALVDAVDDPWNSPAVQDIKRRAADCIKKAQRVWGPMPDALRKDISVRSSHEQNFVSGGGFGGGSVEIWDYWWEEGATGKTGPKNRHQISMGGGTRSELGADAESITEAQCEAHKQQVVAQLVSDMGDPDSVIARWQDVAAVPLPLPSKAQINSFTGTWNGNTLVLAWQTTSAEKVWLRVECTDSPLFPLPDGVNQLLTVGKSGTRDFVFLHDRPRPEDVFLLGEDVHGRSTGAVCQF